MKKLAAVECLKAKVKCLKLFGTRLIGGGRGNCCLCWFHSFKISCANTLALGWTFLVSINVCLIAPGVIP